MVIKLSKNKLFIILLCIVLLCVCIISFFSNNNMASTPNKKYKVVIDAGHGGIDGGVVSYSGNIKESDINLNYALYLGDLFDALDFDVIYTRTNANGLYSDLASNKKKDDMKKRQEIIANANCDLMISIHQNGYILPDQRGITAFYKIEDKKSKMLANTIQNRFQNSIDYARSEALKGDYYILNTTDTLCVLIECGFLTNPDDEKLLASDEYKQKVCFQIVTGCMQYFLENDKLAF